MAETYFAQRDSKDLVDHLMRFDNQWSRITSPYENGIGSVWSRNLNAYYSNLMAGDTNSGLDFDGQLGELVKMVVPQARSLTTQFLSLTTKQKLHFEPQAMSNDARTLSDARLASALCEDIVRSQNMDQKGYRVAELSGIMGSCYIKSCWAMDKGRATGIHPDNGQVQYSGGLRVGVFTDYDLCFDHTIEDFYEQDWVRVRVLKNRWDLIASHPSLEEEIRKLPTAYTKEDMVFQWQTNINEDMVWVYEFFHRATPALPLGRYTVYSSKGAIYFDDHNPYKDDSGAIIPIAEMKPEPVAGTGFGYPFFSNLLPMQEMLDHNMSALSSNNNAFAVKSILNPMGNDINVKHIQGLKFISYKPMSIAGNGRPEVLDLNTSNPELYRFNDTLITYMQQIANINSAIRGEPGAGITSGTAIATLSANAIEFAQNFTKAYINCLETAMYHAILCYRNFASEPEVVAIAGPNDSTIAKTFVGSDLATIKRVKCSISNPLMATAAGKLEVANNLLQTGQFSIKRYLKVLEGAPIDALYDREFDEENFIQEENDALRSEDGEQVKALATDDHPVHMQAHKSLLDNNAIRQDPVRYQRVLDHILEHYELAKQTDPMLYQMLKTGQMPDMSQMQSMQQPEVVPPGIEDPMAAGAANVASPAQAPASIENNDMGGQAPIPNAIGVQ